MAKFKVVALIGLFALLIGVVWISPPSTASAQEFHVTNAAELQDALDEAGSNGEDDVIYLAAGTYEGNFAYWPNATEHKSLTITGESGTSAADIILDGQGSGRALNLYDWSEGAIAEIVVNGITVQNGNSSDCCGGGIQAICTDYNISVTDCVIRNNTGVCDGGGIYMETDQHKLTLENCLILNNSVAEHPSTGKSRGGGAALEGGGSYTVRNNIIVGNTVQLSALYPYGGGLYVLHSGSASISLIGNTIYGNQADKGGGVYVHVLDTANVYNNIIYGNSATDGDDIYFDAVTNRIGYNNDYTELYGTWTDSGANIDANPLFVDPAVGDYHLQADSPCIDAGTSDVPDPPGLPTTDFDGNDRVIGSAPDIGAYEFVPPGGLSGGAIAGIVVGALVAAGLIAYFLIRRRRAAGKRA